MSAGPSEAELLAALLEATHATVYGYGVLGARLDDRTRPAALLAFDSHRSRRDQLAARLRDRGAQAPAAEAAYDVAVTGPGEAAALAVRLEEGMGLRWHDLVAGTDDLALRGMGAAALAETAVRAARWRLLAGTRPPTVALPGVS